MQYKIRDWTAGKILRAYALDPKAIRTWEDWVLAKVKDSLPENTVTVSIKIDITTHVMEDPPTYVKYNLTVPVTIPAKTPEEAEIMSNLEEAITKFKEEHPEQEPQDKGPTHEVTIEFLQEGMKEKEDKKDG